MLIDLVAGNAREILLVIALDDWDAFEDRRRFDGHLALAAGQDLDLLDVFAQAARDATGAPGPLDFADSRHPPGGSPSSGADRVVERIDPGWIEAVAAIPEAHFDRIASRWVELLKAQEHEGDPIGRPVLRELVAELIGFCRDGRDAEDVLLAWSI